MDLTLPSNVSPKSPWLNTLLHGLSHISEFFPDCKLHQMPLKEIRDVPRWQQGALLKFNDKWLYLDVWDYGCPSQQIIERMVEFNGLGLTLPHPAIDAIIKIQVGEGCVWNSPVPVVPWTMFHTDGVNWWKNQPEYRRRYAATEKTFDAGCTGRRWGRRGQWMDYIATLPGIDTDSWGGRTRLGETDDYITRACRWRVGIVLQGQFGKGQTEAKNRREVEFASMGIPMILNYKPTYLNPLLPDVHYIYAEKPEDIRPAIDRMLEVKELFTGAAYQWWLENASIEGVCRTFVQLMEKLGYHGQK